MSTIKTAISLDERLLKRADRVAQELGISRNQLIVLAIEAFLAQRKDKELLDAINQAYHQHPPTPRETTYLNRMRKLYACSLGDEEW